MSSTSTSSTMGLIAQGQCNYNYNDDGYCDESNNIPECNYDGGWCYLKGVQFEFITKVKGSSSEIRMIFKPFVTKVIGC